MEDAFKWVGWDEQKLCGGRTCMNADVYGTSRERWVHTGTWIELARKLGEKLEGNVYYRSHGSRESLINQE